MVEIRQTAAFSKWIRGLAGRRTKLAIAKRIDRLAFGHAGDANSVGSGVSELRIHMGPGSQVRDIARAQALAEELQE